MDSRWIFGGFWPNLWWIFGGFCGPLFRPIEVRGIFRWIFGGSSVDFCPRFLVPFLRSIFDPFLDFSWTRICLFYGTFQFSGAVFDLFLDVLLTVLLGRFKQDFTLVDFWWIYRPIFTTLIKSRV